MNGRTQSHAFIMIILLCVAPIISYIYTSCGSVKSLDNPSIITYIFTSFDSVKSLYNIRIIPYIFASFDASKTLYNSPIIPYFKQTSFLLFPFNTITLTIFLYF